MPIDSTNRLWPLTVVSTYFRKEPSNRVRALLEAGITRPAVNSSMTGLALAGTSVIGVDDRQPVADRF